MYYSEELGLPRTDPKRWRLRLDPLGRETWHYISEKEALSSVDNAIDEGKIPISSSNDSSASHSNNQSTYVQYLLGLEDFPAPKEENIKTVKQAAEKGADFLSLLQDKVSGTFPCQYKGPMFMTISYVVANYISQTEIPEPYRIEMIRYIVNTAHPVDGGWGLHSADKSTCFGTTMNYVCLRLLGLPADHPVCSKARTLLHRLGGALGNPHWGKAWLALLNLYEWEGVNPAPPEMWMLPYGLPIHPGKWWVHTRAIYLPLGYVSANKVKCKLDPLLEELRTEIYVQNYQDIDFSKHRNNVCGIDLYYPHTTALNIANWFMVQYEKCRPNFILQAANRKVYSLIKKECANTDYLCIAPINFAFNMIVTYCEEGPKSDAFRRFQNRMNDTLFLGPQGMTIMGTNGVQTWDVAFMVQYLFMAGLAENPKYHTMILRGFNFLVRSQFTEETEPGSHRDKRIGGWPFSTKTQGYTVSDCTAEALKAIIMVQNHPLFAEECKNAISKERLYEAVDVILFIQNKGSWEFGSFSSYEHTRASPLLEKLNPAEVFNNIMVEYPYVECTDSSVLGLSYFQKYYPTHRKEEISNAIKNAIDYITKAQGKDGSWFGSWGVCYTYAGMFALEAYNSVGQNYNNNEAVRKGCDFFISRQREDGGWSESMKSCETGTYVNGEQSLLVQTAWVVIGLLLAEYPHKEPIDKGIELIMDRQLPTGEWKFEDIEGVFNHSCAIEYPSYKFLFPIKALGLYAKKYGDKSKITK